MIEAQVPELADGGYWYVLPAATDTRGNLRPPTDVPVQWCGVYGQISGVWYVLIRAVGAFTHPDIVSSVSPGDVIAAAALQGYLPEGFDEKPGMRVGGM